MDGNSRSWAGDSLSQAWAWHGMPAATQTMRSRAQAEQSKTFQANQEGITERMTAAERTNAELQSEVNLVGDKPKLTEDQLATARNQVKQSRADYTKKLNDVQNTLATTPAPMTSRRSAPTSTA